MVQDCWHFTTCFQAFFEENVMMFENLSAYAAVGMAIATIAVVATITALTENKAH